MSLQQVYTPAARDRHLELMARGRLERWRIRGETARRTGRCRVPPVIRGNDPDASRAAWLAGYDGRTR
jgi:hypothetical protein